jgi:penicillin-binding protein 2B
MTKLVKNRTKVVGIVLFLVFACLLCRVAWLQMVQADDLLLKAKDMWDANSELPATRGAIYDRNGNILAYDGTAYTIAVNPREIEEKKAADLVVKTLAPVLKISESKLRKFVKKQFPDGRYYAQVEVRNEGWKVSREKADEVRELVTQLRETTKDRYFNGVLVLKDTRRYYPSDRLAAHVLGYYDKRDLAIGGVESKYDDILRGTAGKSKYERFADNRFINSGRVFYEEPEHGKSIQLTIDMNIQHFIEEALDEVYDKYKPKRLIAIAVDPNTMEILGLSNRPTFNPNEYGKSKPGDYYNAAVGARYEPGSTFKLVTLGGTVEEKSFHPQEKFQSGAIQIGKEVIHDHNRKGWGEISYLDGLVRSSNVAFVKLGYERLGQQKLLHYIDRFGFGKKTNIDLPGEDQGLIRLKHNMDFVTATYGQGGVSVTAIQQIAAFASIANGGNLMQPHVLKHVLDSESKKVINTVQPKLIKRTISERAANEVSDYLEKVVSDREFGTGRKTYTEGYRIAGKTGTANKVVNRQYSSNTWVLSFVGYAPEDNPKLLVGIFADEPDLKGNYRNGSDVTLPTFQKIMHKSLRYMGVPYHNNSGEKIKSTQPVAATVPDVKQLSIAQMKDALKRENLTAVVLGKGERVLAQQPLAGSSTLAGDKLFVLTEAAGKITLPELNGSSLRDVMQVCALLQKSCSTEGSGYVAKQQAIVKNGKNMTLFTLTTAAQRSAATEQKTVAQTNQ